MPDLFVQFVGLGVRVAFFLLFVGALEEVTQIVQCLLLPLGHLGSVNLKLLGDLLEGLFTLDRFPLADSSLVQTAKGSATRALNALSNVFRIIKLYASADYSSRRFHLNHLSDFLGSL